MVAGLFLLGTASGAFAQAARARSPEFNAVATVSAANPAVSVPWTFAPPPHRSLQWDAKGRWGFRLDMNEPVNRERAWKDVQAGAYFKITPSLRVGGTLGLGARDAPREPVTPPDAQPRVRLETSFKF